MYMYYNVLIKSYILFISVVLYRMFQENVNTYGEFVHIYILQLINNEIICGTKIEFFQSLTVVYKKYVKKYVLTFFWSILYWIYALLKKVVMRLADEIILLI